MILGLDISTSITGVSIVDRNNELIYCEAWRTDKPGLSFYEKLDIVKDNICHLKSQYPIEKMSTVRPLVENEYEIAGKEISEHKLE